MKLDSLDNSDYEHWFDDEYDNWFDEYDDWNDDEYDKGEIR